VDVDDAMAALEAAGTPGRRAIYRRHGASDPLFGVSFADLGKLAKRAGKDQRLAEALWRTGNADARQLATMVADPARIGARTLGAWAREVGHYYLAGGLAGLAAATPHADALLARWTRSREEWIGRAGWHLLAHLAREPDRDDGPLAARIGEIERRIHGEKNRVRDAMLDALAAIGIRSATLERAAVAAARRIGPVEVDHGETGCVTRDPIATIRKARARRAGRAPTRKARARPSGQNRRRSP